MCKIWPECNSKKKTIKYEHFQNNVKRIQRYVTEVSTEMSMLPSYPQPRSWKNTLSIVSLIDYKIAVLA